MIFVKPKLCLKKKEGGGHIGGRIDDFHGNETRFAQGQ